MNNVTHMMTNYNNNINFDICHLDQLLEIGASPVLTLESTYYLETMSFCIASMIGVFSMIYNFIIKTRARGLKLHFIGIQPPQNFTKSQHKLLDNINTSNIMITLQTSLKPTDTINTLKQLIHKTYNISTNNDILILYSHHIISNNSLTLNEIGINNNALLTIAICDENKLIAPIDIHHDENEHKTTSLESQQPDNPATIIEPEYESESETESDEYNGDMVNNMFEMYEDYESEPEPVESVNELFGMFADYKSDSDDDITETELPEEEITYPKLGFDIITQEHDVLVHQMPTCGHEMNKDSLYEYTFNTFNDSSNMYLKCPHNTCDNMDKLCDTKWEYKHIINILQYENNNQWIKYAKLELLSSRNVIENNGNFQKCPRCKTLYFKNQNENTKPLHEINTIEDIENEFKFKCIICPNKSIEYIEKIKVEIEEKDEKEEKGHNEDDIIEDINGNDINNMFGGNYDSDVDSDSDFDDSEFEEQQEALDAIAHMFDIDFIENKIIKYLNEFCFCCGVEWNNNHICDSTFKNDLCEILSVAETKKIGSVENVPSIRCCPNCCQLIFHVDACKHMKCGGCKVDFCFVCTKPKKDGNWQCGSHSSACPVAPIQNMDTLPDTIVITKQSFQLFD